MVGAVGGSLVNLVYPYFLDQKGWRGPAYRRVQNFDFLLAVVVMIVFNLAVWTLGAEPFLTEPGTLSRALSQAIEAECGVAPELSTSGGTSDGRFIRRIADQVIEFGPVNASIHQVDECVELEAIEPLKNVYRRTLELLLA